MNETAKYVPRSPLGKYHAAARTQQIDLDGRDAHGRPVKDRWTIYHTDERRRLDLIDRYRVGHDVLDALALEHLPLVIVGVRRGLCYEDDVWGLNRFPPGDGHLELLMVGQAGLMRGLANFPDHNNVSQHLTYFIEGDLIDAINDEHGAHLGVDPIQRASRRRQPGETPSERGERLDMDAEATHAQARRDVREWWREDSEDGPGRTHQRLIRELRAKARIV